MAKEDVQFCVNIDGPIAVYVQIENLVQFAIAAGKLNPGDTLPSVREMSETLKINPNTVTKAYRDLELMKLVHTRRGVGVTVSAEAPKLCRENARAMAKEHLIDATAECIASGLSAADVRKIVGQAIDSGANPYQVP
ncbi:MAG: GntR family transcriptional regulator [Candidatus Hydrogenedentes bacterium]|nr:GntR family transcriptional regulator [Candidatus Hydrogenedentota bacterium]MBI3118863.1 GntR family transcriptional regulator [Candidatus Hydrogenedentota bacterium]